METLVLPPVDSLRKKRKEASLPVGAFSPTGDAGALRLVYLPCPCWRKCPAAFPQCRGTAGKLPNSCGHEPVWFRRRGWPPGTNDQTC